MRMRTALRRDAVVILAAVVLRGLRLGIVRRRPGRRGWSGRRSGNTRHGRGDLRPESAAGATTIGGQGRIELIARPREATRIRGAARADARVQAGLGTRSASRSAVAGEKDDSGAGRPSSSARPSHAIPWRWSSSRDRSRAIETSPRPSGRPSGRGLPVVRGRTRLWPGRSRRRRLRWTTARASITGRCPRRSRPRLASSG